MIKIKNINPKDKAFRIINIILSIAFVLACIAMFIYYMCIGDPKGRAFTCLLTIVPAVLPYIIECITHKRIGNITMLIYTIFVFYAAFVGSVLSVFKFSDIYDKIAHTLFGYLGSYIGLWIGINFVDKKAHPWKVAVICILFTMACASFWEIFEFSGDTFFGQTAQGYPVNGITDVTDTMMDICVTLIGSLVFQVQYALHVLTRKDWFIATIINDFGSYKNDVNMKSVPNAQKDVEDNEEVNEQ